MSDSSGGDGGCGGCGCLMLVLFFLALAAGATIQGAAKFALLPVWLVLGMLALGLLGLAVAVGYVLIFDP